MNRSRYLARSHRHVRSHHRTRSRRLAPELCSLLLFSSLTACSLLEEEEAAPKTDAGVIDFNDAWDACESELRRVLESSGYRSPAITVDREYPQPVVNPDTLTRTFAGYYGPSATRIGGEVECSVSRDVETDTITAQVQSNITVDSVSGSTTPSATTSTRSSATPSARSSRQKSHA